MKKFVHLSLVAMFAVNLSACDNGNQSNATQAATKAESTLSAKEQFRQDYETFVKWQKQAQQTFTAEVVKLQQKVAEQQTQTPNVEEAKKVLSNFRDKVTETNKELDTLNLKDSDVKALAEKMKEVHEASVDFFDFMIQNAGNAKDAEKNMPIVQEKMKKFQELQIQVQAMSEKLDQKYRQ